MILDEGMTKWVNDFAGLITQAQSGTATTLPLKTDTGLTSVVSATIGTVTTTFSGDSVIFQHTIGTSVANNITLNEHELRFANGDSLTRHLLGGVNKTASYILITDHTVSFIRGT